MHKAFLLSLLAGIVVALPTSHPPAGSFLPTFTSIPPAWSSGATLIRAPRSSSVHASILPPITAIGQTIKTVLPERSAKLGDLDATRSFLEEETRNIFSLFEKFIQLPQQLNGNTKVLYAILLEDYLTTVRAHTSPWLNQGRWEFGAPLDKPNAILKGQGTMLSRLGRVLQAQGDALPAAELELNWMGCHVIRSNEQINRSYYADLIEAGLDFKTLSHSVCLSNHLAVPGAFFGTPQWNEWANADRYGFRYAKSSLLAILPRAVGSQCTVAGMERLVQHHKHSTDVRGVANRGIGQTSARNKNEFESILALLAFLDGHAFHSHSFQNTVAVHPRVGDATIVDHLISCPNVMSAFKRLSQDANGPLTGWVKIEANMVVVSASYTVSAETTINESAWITWDLMSDVADGIPGRPAQPVRMTLPPPVEPALPKETTVDPNDFKPEVIQVPTWPESIKEHKKCFPGGHEISAKQMMKIVDSFCSHLEDHEGILNDSCIYGGGVLHNNSPHHPVTEVCISIDIAPGHAWKVDKNVCRHYFDVITNDCDEDTADGKQGGVVSADGIKFLLDPNGISADGAHTCGDFREGRIGHEPKTICSFQDTF